MVGRGGGTRAVALPDPGGDLLIAHVSDLHIGRDAQTDEAARSVAEAIEVAGIGVIVLTGDVTHQGRASELATFERTFRRLQARRRVLVVPGNHDRLTDGAGEAFMRGARVSVDSRPGLHAVRLDSTGPHNRRLLAGHGLLTLADLDAVDSALGAAPEGALTVLALHHHLLPLPGEGLVERVAGALRLPHVGELPLGAALLARIRGRCDLVLHGHRHVPAERVLGAGTERPLRVLNAGATGDLGALRVLSARGNRVERSEWLEVARPGEQPLAGALVGPAAA